MDKRVWSNSEFNEIKERINKEILRRGTFKWNDPLCQPTVGHDKSSPREIPHDEHHRYITDKSYTINNPSNGAIIETRNIDYPLEGNSLGNDVNSSAALVNLDEIKNYLIGLSKIKDIKLFYGRDEEEGTAFRDPIGIEDVLLSAEQDVLNQDTTKDGKIDPLTGKKINYEIEDGKYIMPSGESDGEEMLSDILDENNFFDDYGAEPGDGNFHPYNPAISKIVERNWIEQGESRNKGRGPEVIKNIYGGTKSSDYGPNPRNPQPGKPFKGRPVKEGVPGTCQNMCTGICSLTCDNECSESCSSTCFGRCGNTCTSTCGNLCTGCSGQCYSSCKSKCENTSGYSCLKAGAKTVKIYSTGGKNGEPAKNHLEASYYSCTGCSYSCQFYPNKKTSCWDAGCMGKCFTSCTNSCSTSCFGGCIDNASENSGDYKTGKGRGCSAGCTINCIGNCEGTCEGQCIHTCFRTCQESCSDNCMYKCSTNCGSGCESSCVNGCKDECSGKNSSKNCNAGCSSMCQNDCNANCVGIGCKSLCGIDNAGACFKAGTLIETINGPVPIEEIKVGDLVLTQSGEYHKVYNTMKRSPELNELMLLHPLGAPILYTTKNHPFWIKKYKTEGKLNGKRQQLYYEPNWINVKDISHRDKVCLYTPKFGNKHIDEGVAYMVGRWLGDGWIEKTKEKKSKSVYLKYIICCGFHKVNKFDELLYKYNISYYKEKVYEYTTCQKYRIKADSKESIEFMNIVSKCGKYAYGKFIPQEIFEWDEISLYYLLQGYLDSDGNIVENKFKHIIFVTISKKLAYGISTILRMFKKNPSVYTTNKNINSGFIMGRQVNIRTKYTVRTQLEDFTRHHSFYDDNFTWATTRIAYKSEEKYDVYNISVEGDPTYYADGVLVHNCDSNCRLSCMSSSCTSLCSDACSSACTSCVNGCDLNCGMCTSNCSTGCTEQCNITCSAICENSCSSNCVQSCSEQCGSCSSLCYSCVGMCVSQCSFKCENGCTSCANQCSYWCDINCSNECFGNCSTLCLNTCNGTCSTSLTSNSSMTSYQYKDRKEEQKAFKIYEKIPPYIIPEIPDKEYPININFNEDNKLVITSIKSLKWVIYSTTNIAGIFIIDEKTGEISINEEFIESDLNKINEIYYTENLSIFVIRFLKNDNIEINEHTLGIKLPWGFEIMGPIKYKEDTLIIIKRIKAKIRKELKGKDE